MPMVHCYCFTRELVNERAKEDIQKVCPIYLALNLIISISQRVEEVLKWKLEDEVQFHMVRNVAPGKDMWCISFRLPREVGFARED